MRLINVHRNAIDIFIAGLLATTLVACDTGEHDDDHVEGEKSFRSDRDFVPGDPSFKRSPALDIELESAKGLMISHNMGESCQRCHQSKGPGRGQFTLAGTLYKGDGSPFPNATLKLYGKAQAPDGGPVRFEGPAILTEEIMAIPVDGRGNFYTTKKLPDFYPAKPVFPKFFGPNGEELWKPDMSGPAHMGGGVQTGGCNHCHGNGFRVTGVLQK
jgi:hypothetical protein